MRENVTHLFGGTLELTQLSKAQLDTLEKELSDRYQSFKGAKLNLDMTRGKPAASQCDLANEIDGILKGKYLTADGTDTRNYGGLDGTPEAKALFAPMLGVSAKEILIGGNSSLQLMYQYMLWAYFFGPAGADSAWSKEGKVKFLCPSPGYDRHFAICEELGIEMIPVAFTKDGPDMDKVEQLVKSDSSIKGMWCVPKYSNPTGHVYSDSVVSRIAKLGKIAGPNFRVIWDNAYAVHELTEKGTTLANIAELCRSNGTDDSVVQFGSTSKITFAGAGLAFMAASEANLKNFQKRLGIMTIGPDKVNQQRHVLFLKDMDGIKAHMQKLATQLKPKFDIILERLEEGLKGKGIATWTTPLGGYFISLDTLPGLAKEVVKLAADVGVKLTPAGATWPYGKDPEDKNIRLAPTFPNAAQLDTATQVLVICVELATVRKLLK